MKMKGKFNGKTIELIKGDITSQGDIKTVVNAANSWLRPGGGVAGAIHRKAGPQLYEECKTKNIAPINPGQAVITSAYKLPNDYVVHCLGPVYGKDKPEDKKLRNCYKAALLLVDERKLNSIAFPSISTGAFGYPVKEASEIALKTVFENISYMKNLNYVRFVLFSDDDFQIYKESFERELGRVKQG